MGRGGLTVPVTHTDHGHHQPAEELHTECRGHAPRPGRPPAQHAESGDPSRPPRRGRRRRGQRYGAPRAARGSTTVAPVAPGLAAGAAGTSVRPPSLVRDPGVTGRPSEPPARCPWGMPKAHALCFSAAAFLRASKARLYVLLKQQEDQSLFNMKEWVTREASNQDALQEAGTFRYWAMGGVARCGSGTRAPRPWTARPRASSASSVRFRAVPVFPKGGRMVWVEVRWGLLDSGLLFCVCTFCRKNSAQLNKSRMCVPAGC